VSKGNRKDPQLMPSTPRWVVANGASVILSMLLMVSVLFTVCLTVTLAGQSYYAIATPSATQRLLLGLLEAPPI